MSSTGQSEANLGGIHARKEHQDELKAEAKGLEGRRKISEDSEMAPNIDSTQYPILAAAIGEDRQAR